MARLTEAWSRGELRIGEFNERSEAALRAVYVDELAALTRDLPEPSAPGTGGRGARARRRSLWHRGGFKYHAVPYLMVNGMLVGIWALTGHGLFWPFFPIAGWGIGLGMHAVAAGGRPKESRLPAADASDTAQRPRLTAAEPSLTYVAVLFADMVGSTEFNERLGDAGWNPLRTRYLTIMRDCVQDNQGTEVSTQGDGLFARFDLPAGAVAAALAMQKRVDAERMTAPSSPLVRIGIHAGQVIEDGDDLIGNMVNLAARLTADAAPGQVLVTESVADLAGEAFSFDDCGLRQLRGLSRPRHVLSVRR